MLLAVSQAASQAVERALFTEITETPKSLPSMIVISVDDSLVAAGRASD